MRRINVLICITQLELGGAQQGVLYLVKHLDKTKFRVVLVSSPGELANEAIQIRDAKIMLIDSLRREISPASDLKALRELSRIIREEKIDIIHTNSSKAGILGRWAGWWRKVPVIVHTIHGWPFHDYLSSRKKKVYVWLEKQTARITTRLIAVAHANIDKGLREDIGTRDQYQVIRCGIELKKFQSKSARKKVLKEFSIPEDAKVVGMVACFKPQKSPVDFVKVASRVARENPDAYFILVGDGVLRPEIETWIRKYNLEKKFILTGWRHDVSEIMSAFDILAHTSLWEGLPCVFSQAMAKGIPIVATNVDGASEAIVDSLTGYLVLPREVRRMANKINHLLKDEALMEKLGLNAKKYVEPFDIDIMVRKYDELFVRLAKEKISDIN